MEQKKLVAAIALATSTLVSSAFAAPVTFFGEDINAAGDPNALAATPNSDAAEAAFLSNLTGVGTEDFEGIATGTPPPLSLVFPGAGTATLTGGTGVESGNDGFGRYPISGRNYYYAGSNNFTIDFDSPIAAFGFYGVDIGDYGADLTLTLTDTLANETVLNVPLTTGSGGDSSGSVLYFGFYDTATQYTSISFTNTSGGGDAFAFDDMTIGSLEQVNPMPLPATLALFGLGLGGLGLFRRRKECVGH